MLFARIENNEVAEYPIVNIQSRFPHTSFCSPITEDQLPPGYVIIKEDEYPTINSNTHKIEERTPTKRNGIWTRNLVVVALSEDELQGIEMFMIEHVSNKASEILQQTDWTQLPDVALKNKEEFAQYRALIREIRMNPSANQMWPEQPAEVWE